MDNTVISPDHIAENLMLLVGINPLPNYVAAKLMANKDTRLHLIVTDEIISANIHKRLIKLLERDVADKSQYIHLRSSDPQEIYATVAKRVANHRGSWGVNYNCGKESIAAHAYRAMEATLAVKHQEGVYKLSRSRHTRTYYRFSRPAHQKIRSLFCYGFCARDF